MNQYNVGEAKARLSDLLKRALLGEEIVIARDNKPLVRLVPVAPVPKRRAPGSAKGKILEIAPDFDNTPDDFKDYR